MQKLHYTPVVIPAFSKDILCLANLASLAKQLKIHQETECVLMFYFHMIFD